MEVTPCKKSNDERIDKEEEDYKMGTLAYFRANERRRFLHGMVKFLPKSLQSRLTVLKNMQIDYFDIERQLYEEMFYIERKYHEKLVSLYNKRKDIISGKLEPDNELPKWKEFKENSSEMPLNYDYCNILKIYKSVNEETKGVPNFWLTVLKTSERISDIIYELDEPLLSKLTDITIDYNDLSYTIEFHFDENEYIHNKLLTKQYFLSKSLDMEYPFNYDGPNVIKCVGCEIEWKDGKNLTVKKIKYSEEEDDVVPVASFFHFFNPPKLSKEDMDVETQEILFIDFEIGQFMRDELIPRAILFFTGDYFEDSEHFIEEKIAKNGYELSGNFKKLHIK